VVNSYFVVRSANDGAQLSGPTALSAFFQTGLAVFEVFDPRCKLICSRYCLRAPLPGWLAGGLLADS
jgi:hypothetical protein